MHRHPMNPAQTEEPGKVEGNFSNSQLSFLMKDMYNQLQENKRLF